MHCSLRRAAASPSAWLPKERVSSQRSRWVCDAALREVYLQRQRTAIASLSMNRPASVMQSLPMVHGRMMWDDVASPSEAFRAREAAMRAMELVCDSDRDGSRLFPLDAPAAEGLLGSSHALLKVLHERVCEKVCERYGPSRPVGQLLSWISGSGDPTLSLPAEIRSFNSTQDPVVGTFAPHVGGYH